MFIRCVYMIRQICNKEISSTAILREITDIIEFINIRPEKW